MSGVPFSLQAADMLHGSGFVERDEVMCINLRTELCRRPNSRVYLSGKHRHLSNRSDATSTLDSDL